jgi:hypothetical protein
MKIGLGLAALLAAFVLPLAAHADSATKQTVDVTGWNDHIPAPTSDVHGTASLVRRDNGISMTLHTSGLPAGEPATVWWIILDGPNVVSAQFAAGHVVGNNGVATFAGSLAEGDTSGCFHPSFPDAQGCRGLTDAQSQTVILLVRTHGPKNAGDVPTQIHTSEAGGPTFEDDLCNAVFCQIQAAIFPGA